MASRPALVRLKDFQIKQHRRAIEQLHVMIADIELLADNLDRDIRAEEDRSGMHDPTFFAYPTFAKAAIQRRDNLRQSADRLKTQLDVARKSLSETIEEFEAIADGRDQTRDRSQIRGLERPAPSRQPEPRLITVPCERIPPTSIIKRKVDVSCSDRCLIISINRNILARALAFEACHLRRLNEHGLNREFLSQFSLPLITEMRGREHGQTLRDSPIQQFAGDHTGFDGLADANVVRDQEPHRIEPKCHDQRHELIRARGDR